MGLKYLETVFNNRKLIIPSNIKDEIIDVISDCNKSCDDAIDVLNQLLLYDKLESSLLVLDKSYIPIIPFLQETIQPFEKQVIYIST
jgi:hypothetical protein